MIQEWYVPSKAFDETVNLTVKTQRERFEAVARELECDDDEARFDERTRKLIKRKSVEKPE